MQQISRKAGASIALALCCALILSAAAFAPVYAAEEVIVEINGQRVYFPDQQPVIVNDRTLVPVRGVFETLGYAVDWSDVSSTATLSNGVYTVRISVGESSFYTNGVSYALDVPAQLINNRTMLPFRAVLESVGCGVDWDGARNAVLVTGSGVLKPPAPSDQNLGLFADNPGYTYKGVPTVPPYKVEPGLSNIVNRQQFTTGYRGLDWDANYYYQAADLSGEAIGLIEKNGFAVSDASNWDEFYGLYEWNRYNYAPSFITTDSVLHTYHLMFDYILRDLEQRRLYDELKTLSAGMLAASEAQYAQLKGTEFENAALRNVAFFAVGASLLSPGYSAPAYVGGLVSQELELIKASAGIGESPLLNAGGAQGAGEPLKEDYSQYIPRSHYTRTPELTAYFKAMMWYGRITFYSNIEDQVKSALLQLSALQDGALASRWKTIFEPTNFFVGECDDITWLQYQGAVKDIYGDSLGDLEAICDPGDFRAAVDAVRNLEPPKINSIPNDAGDESERASATAGYRFMGQRFTVDGAIMQRLMHIETPGRMLPKALDIPAALGSDEAYEILKSMGEADEYPKYAENMNKVRRSVAAIDAQTWRSNLYWSWMDMLKTLAGPQSGQGMPFFMQNSAWSRKELNTFLGSWSELKHDTLLYSKQPMAEGDGEANPPEPPDDRGYVEPNPALYGRMSALIKMTSDGLDQRGLLTATAREGLGSLKTLSDGLLTISEKLLANQSPTEDEYDFIRYYGAELEGIFYASRADAKQAEEWDDPSPEKIGAIIADVATDTGGIALEEATGFAKVIYVAFPRDGKVALGRGLVYSHYEFETPIANRMTDEAWRERLLEGDAPPVDEWKKAFVADTE